MATAPHPEIPAAESDPGNSLAPLLTSAAFAPLPATGWLRATGSDRVRWLNGMVTNSIQALTPGQGCYNFVLNAQGRIQGDLTAFLLDDAILLETTQPAALATLLDRFIIMDDVELTDISSTRTGLLLAGPHAPAILTSLDLPTPAPLHLHSGQSQGDPLDVIHARSPLIPRFELWADPSTIDSLTHTLTAAGIAHAHPADLEQLRLLEGTPRYAIDIRNTETARDLPQETAQAHALHFNKGCYLGQEIVERIRSRGQVHRTFTGLLLTGALPPAGTPLTTSEGKPAGEITSAATIPHPTAGPLQLALGYLRREALTPATSAPLQYPGGTASPINLPYIPG